MAMPNIQGMDTEYKPWGGLAGIMTGEREGLQHFANLQGMEEAQLSNVLKQVEASRAANDFSNPEMERWRQAKLMGEGMQQDALGRLKQGTLNTDSSAGNQKNQTETLENQAKAWMTESDMILSLPDGLAGATSGMQLSPQMQALAQQVGGIDRLKMVLPKINEMLKTQISQSPKHRADMEMEGFKQEGTFITEDMKQQEANKRQKMEVDAKYAEITQRRSEASARKTEANESKLEQAITGRINAYRSLLIEIGKRKDALIEMETDPLFRGTKEEKVARKKQIADAKKTLEAEETKIKQQIITLNDQSVLGATDGGSTVPQPQVPALPPGVTVVPTKK